MGGSHRNGIAHRTLKAQQTLRAVEQVRGSLTKFAKVMRRGRIDLAPLHKRLIETLEGVESGKHDRVMVFMPPRHGKSLLSSEMMPAWYLGRHPDRSIIAASYSAELATDFGRRVRNMLIDPIYRTIFPRAVVSPDSSAAHRFNLVTGGAYYAVGAGGPLTGRGAELLIIDDPLKGREEADSDAFRKQLHAWYESVAYTRLQPGGAIVLIQTRWHEDDLAGWLLREHVQENWQVVSLPAIAEANDPLGRREGAPLWQSHFSLETLDRIRQAIGGAAWASLYQQRPAAAEGAIFKRQWWQYWTEATLPPHFEQLVISLDTAFKATSSSDYSVGLVVGMGRTGYYVLDCWRQRCEFPALKRAIEMLVMKWNPDRVLIEDTASGQSLIQELKLISRAPIFPIKIDSDKVSRANAATPMAEAGRVFLPQGVAWVTDFIDELSSFPRASHDDQVDSLTQALNFLRNNGGPSVWFEAIKRRVEAEAAAVCVRERTRESYGRDANLGAVDDMRRNGGVVHAAFANHFERAERERMNPRIGWPGGDDAPGMNIRREFERAQAQSRGDTNPYVAITAEQLGERAGDPVNGVCKCPGVIDLKNHAPAHLVQKPPIVEPPPKPVLTEQQKQEIKAVAERFAATLRGNPVAVKVLEVLAAALGRGGQTP
jgi:predicted phage terminase large subunit-like protein